MNAMDNHAYNIGRLIVNFQSLEFVLRGFLQNLPSATPIGLAPGVDLYTSPVGSDLPVNNFTNYDTLGALIDKFNSEMIRLRKSPLDRSLVEIRDALAHGRVSSASPTDTTRLIKFDKPINGKVRVVFNESLTTQWFETQIDRVAQAIHTVHNAIEP